MYTCDMFIYIMIPWANILIILVQHFLCENYNNNNTVVMILNVVCYTPTKPCWHWHPTKILVMWCMRNTRAISANTLTISTHQPNNGTYFLSHQFILKPTSTSTIPKSYEPFVGKTLNKWKRQTSIFSHTKKNICISFHILFYISLCTILFVCICILFQTCWILKNNNNNRD